MFEKIIYHLGKVDKIVKGEKYYPISCEIDPSNHCQNRCSFCMYKDYLASDRVDLDFGLYTSLVYSLQSIGVKSITFTGGGEPLMNKYFIDMVIMAKSCGFKVGLITNGIELNKLKGIYDEFTFIRVSLDAGDAGTYKKIKGTDYFYHVLYNVSDAVRDSKKTTIGLSHVVCKDNLDSVNAAKEIAEIIGVSYIQFKPVFGDENIIEKVNSDGLITKRFYDDSLLSCKIAGLIGIVCADGNVYYCCQHRGDNDYLLGNIRQNDFGDIWGQRDKLTPKPKLCGSCRYAGYAQMYSKYAYKKYDYLRHEEFL